MPSTSADDSLWIRRYHPAPASRATLVCFPHAGGSASFFHPVSTTLTGDLEVLAVQYPGRQDRRTEPCVDTIDELADKVHAALRPRAAAGTPLAFFGHSMGAILAFEVALRLAEHDGVTPVELFASGRRAPSTSRHETVHRRDDRGIVRELQTLSGTDAAVLGDEELLRMILPAIRADYRAIETYACRPDAVIDAPITVLVGDNDPKVTLDEAMAWGRHSTREIDLRIFPGGHFYLARHAAAVNGVIADHLLAARQPT